MQYILAGTMAMEMLMTNSVRHLLKHSVRADEICVVAPDEETLSFFQKTIPCEVIISSESLVGGEQKYKQGDWGRIVKWKLKAISDTLVKSDIIYIDPDVVVFEDIRKFLPSEAWDICVQRHKNSRPCMGILAVRSTEFSRGFLFPPNKAINSDDEYIGSKWDWNNPKLKFLSDKLFPVGCIPLNRPPAICYHYNYTVGIGGKIRRMKKDGNWLLE